MRIMYVSEYDRCRGPMARVQSKRLAKELGVHGITFDSAGLHVTESLPASEATIVFLRSEKITINQHRSKPLAPTLVDSADIIMCMTRELTLATKAAVGEHDAPKVVLLNEAVDLSTTKMNIEVPATESMQAYRRLWASFNAALGILIRHLEEPGACPEWFGAKTIPRRYKPKAEGGGGGASLPPEKRTFLANFIFDLVSRSFEPMGTWEIQEGLYAAGHELTALEVEELLQQDLHGYVRLDSGGSWVVVPGADVKRRDKQKEAYQKAKDQAKEQQREERQKKKEEKLTREDAFETLGVTAETSFEEAQKKYRALLKRYHPDKFHDDDEFREMAEDKTKRLNMAWSMLKEELQPEAE